MNLTEAVKTAGIVGAGGAGFPTHVKLAAKAEIFIINAAECEPLIETDKFLMRTFADKIVVAAEIVAAHLGAKRKVLALKGKYHAEIDALKKALSKANSDLEIFEMPTFYPAGDEQMMVYMVTGKSVPERGLPLDVGAVVDNVGTLINIFDALDGNSVTDKYLSVVGEVKEPIMLHVPIGTSIRECIEKAQPVASEFDIILGGPMMGKVKLYSEIDSLTVTKTTGNIIVLPKNHYLVSRAVMPISRIKAQTRSACIQCKFCTDLCPRFLIGHQMRPNLVMRNFYRESLITDDEEYKKTFGDAANCCSCGVCEMFSCPMGLSPRKVNDFIKGQLAQKGIKVERNLNPTAREGIAYKLIPTDRLVARLGIMDYYGLHAKECFELTPDTVAIPFRQHIGAPAVPVKNVGDHVKKGELLAMAKEGALSANIHASVDGVVLEVDGEKAVISRSKE